MTHDANRGVRIRPLPGMEWAGDALCATLPDRVATGELFFATDATSQERARAICRRCPVTARCLAWAVATNQEHGTWGGVTEAERDAVKRRHRRAWRGQSVGAGDGGRWDS